jgi:class 3 adenylate cyclase
LRPAEVEVSLRRLRDWGTLEYGQAWAAEFESDGLRPTDVDIRWMAKSSRNTCTPDVAIAMNEMWWETDLTEVLPSVRVPTLLLVESPDETYLAKAEYVAALMPAAELVVIPGEQWPTAAIMQAYIRPPLEAVGRFLGLAPTRPELDSVLASVLFTDIVGSTRQQAALGDHAWKEVLQRHNALVRGLLAQWRGVERDTAGDGFYATFDGPARAVRCALGIVAGAAELGLEVRAGVHTGECEVIDGKLAGIAVATGARIAALAAPSQVLVSQTVKDLVAGSRLGLDDVGERQLRGVPGNWRLYAAAG